jgi:hypothetical protein
MRAALAGAVAIAAVAAFPSVWTVLFWIVVAWIVFWFWMFIGSASLCPRCGVELPSASLFEPPAGLGLPIGKANYCPRCGWRRGASP